MPLHALPRELVVRQLALPEKSFLKKHKHDWHQFLYATSGVLIVDIQGSRLFIPPEKAVWIPKGIEHSVSAPYLCEMKSLYIESNYQGLNSDRYVVLEVTRFLKALIIEASTFDFEYDEQGYEKKVAGLIKETLPRLKIDEVNLPWPSDNMLIKVCEGLFDNPESLPTLDILAKESLVSKRTFERKFSKETGMTFRAWYQKLRFLKSFELLNSGQNITEVALNLGFSSSSSFIYMFRQFSGVSPGKYLTTLSDD